MTATIPLSTRVTPMSQQADPSAVRPSTDRTVVVGAGLSGLIAARDLGRAGKRVLVVDKGRSVGGRLATRRIGDAVLDHGAQFFTTRSSEFIADVQLWQNAGIINEWCRGFEDPADGYPRYCTNGGMNQLAKYLAREFEGLTLDGEPLVTVVTRHRVQSIVPVGDSFTLIYEGGSRDVDLASNVIVTSPVPQTLDILDAGGIALDPEIADDVRAIRYHAVIGLLATVDGSPDLGPAGALQTPDGPTFSFVADNAAKGASPLPAVTFHASHERSESLWSLSDEEILAELRPSAEQILGSVTIQDVQVKKWRYAGPVTPWPDRSLTVATSPGHLVLAGDAFGGPKVEGAYLSGRAAASAVLAATA